MERHHFGRIRSAIGFLLALLAVVAFPGKGALAQNEPWRAVNHEAAVLFRQGKFAESEAMSRQGLSICASAGPTEVFCRSIFWEILADDAESQGHPTEAEAAFKQCLAIRQAGLLPMHPLIGDALARLGLFYSRQGRWAESLPVLQQAATVLRAGGTRSRALLISTLTGITTGNQLRGNEAAALDAAQEAASEADALVPEQPERVLPVRSNLAIALARNGRAKEALALALDTLALAQQTGTPATQILLATTVANIAADSGVAGAGVPAIQSALRILDAAPPPPISDFAKARLLNAASRIVAETGRAADALAYAEQARSLADTAHADPAMAGEIDSQLAKMQQVSGRYAESLATYRRATAEYEHVFGATSLFVVDTLQGQVAVAMDADDYPAAEAFMQRVLDILHQPPSRPDWLAVAERLASELKLDVGDLAAAQALADDAAAQQALVAAPTAADRLLVVTQQARVADFRGAMGKARALAAQVASLLDGDAPIGLARRIWVTLVLADLFQDTRNPDAALQMADRAITLAGGEAAGGPSVAWALAIGGRALADLDRYAEAENACTRAMALADRLQSMSTWLLAANCLGAAQLGRRELQQASQLFQSVLSRLGPDDTVYVVPRIRALEGLGGADRELGRYSDAVRTLDAAVALAEAGKDARLGLLADCLGLRGSVLRRLGRYPAAEQDFTRSLAAWERVEGGDLHRAEALNGLGLTRLDAGDLAGAEQPLRTALALRLQAGNDQAITESRGNLAALDMMLGKPRDAAGAFAAVAAAEVKAGQADSGTHAITLARQADAMARLGETADAERLERAAIDIDARSLGPDNPILAGRMLRLAGLIELRGARQEAAALRATALKLFAAVYGEASPITAMARLAELPDLARQGRRADVAGLLDGCVASVGAAFGKDSPMLVDCLTASAGSAQSQGDFPGAAGSADHAIAIETQAGGATSPALAPLLLLRASIDLSANKPKDALAQCAAADAVLGADPPVPIRSRIAAIRAAAQSLSGTPADAEATLHAALALLPVSQDAFAVQRRIEITVQLAALLARTGQNQAASAAWADLSRHPVPAWAEPQVQWGLGQTYLATGRPQEALAAFTRAAGGDEALHGADALETYADHAGAADALAMAGHSDLATAELHRIEPGKDRAADIMRLTALRNVALAQDDYTAAAIHQARLRSLLADWTGADSPALLPSTVLLARLDVMLGRRDEAGTLMRQAADMALHDGGSAATELAQLSGEIAWDEGHMAAAEASFRQAVGLAAGPSGSVRQQGDCHAELGRFLLATGKLPDARQELTTALPLLENSDGSDSIAVGHVLAGLSGLADKSGDHQNAAALRSRAQAIFGEHGAAATPDRWL